jgi:hypothetical protein
MINNIINIINNVVKNIGCKSMKRTRTNGHLTDGIYMCADICAFE